MHTDFSCPACSADLEVRERLDEPARVVERERASNPLRDADFSCPACSADLVVRERLSSAEGNGAAGAAVSDGNGAGRPPPPETSPDEDEIVKTRAYSAPLQAPCVTIVRA